MDLLQLGPRNGEDGQLYIAAILGRVLPEIAAWAASLPPGILTLEPWLTRQEMTEGHNSGAPGAELADLVTVDDQHACRQGLESRSAL